MTGVRNRARRPCDPLPPLLLIEGRAHRFADEPAALSGAGDLVDSGHQAVIQLYVYSHVPMMAHFLTRPSTQDTSCR